jgi:hypothetical protein
MQITERNTLEVFGVATPDQAKAYFTEIEGGPEEGYVSGELFGLDPDLVVFLD